MAAAEAEVLDSIDKLTANADQDTLKALARITETAERFEDMCHIMGCLVQLKKKNKEALEVEERNMLSVAYKNVVGQRRASWRTLKADEEAEEGSDQEKSNRGKYKTLVENELKKKCEEVLNLLEEALLDKTMDPKKVSDGLLGDNLTTEQAAEQSTVETQVFYLKMCGDYYRYLAEFNSTNQEYRNKASGKYTEALLFAKKALKPTHPTRLGLALNASVCYYEIMNQSEEACKLAKDAFDQAIQQLDSLSDSTYKDSTLIMQLLRDNLTIWTSEQDTGSAEQRED